MIKILVLISILFNSVFSSATILPYNQAITFSSTPCNENVDQEYSLTDNVCHVIVKFFPDYLLSNLGAFTTNENLLVKRSFQNNSGIQASDIILTTNIKYRALKYLIPNWDITHKKQLPFVIYNINFTDSVTSPCQISYEIKYFPCDTKLNNFISTISSDSNDYVYNYYKKDSLNTETLEINLHQMEEFKYLSTSHLKDTLQGKSQCNKLFSASNSITDSCYLPLSCLEDFSSINCICSLIGSDQTDFNLYCSETG